MYHLKDRGLGNTTKQMKSAATNTVIIWCNNYLQYPNALAKHLGRVDLQIRSSSTLDNLSELRGINLPVIVDHAAELTPEQYRNLNVINRHSA
jgi:hypothetical protein